MVFFIRTTHNPLASSRAELGEEVIAYTMGWARKVYVVRS